METIFALFAQYGLVSVFAVVLVKQLGAPVPASPVLLLAGAAAASQPAIAFEALLAATTASVLADFAWFWAGRRFGRRVLALLCQISISPDSCVRKNELSFARRGARTLVVAKFVPGLATLAPPLAGALGMKARSFALFDAVGAALWAGAGIAVGWLFHDQIGRLLLALSELGRAALWLLGGLILLYVGWRIGRRMQDRRDRARIPRVTAQELAEMTRQGLELLVLDVRAQGTALAGGVRIPGARHVDLADVETISTADWPGGAQIITYCDCPNDASATRAAGLLIRRGFGARVLAGGMDGWLGAGHPSEAGQ